ncbi:MAG TPA: RHS repeat-associated core domain-containing protein [Anaerohalosphaeraceae bacterium]|nr:RHS repeat-associated core domain-containing protein [Anaerohalosphaeraceae bacterium]
MSRFTGRELDRVGTSQTGFLEILYYRARYYDPDTGRFLQPDPADGMNLYEYVDSYPLHKLDYMGLCCIEAPYPWESSKWGTSDFLEHYCFGKAPYRKEDPINLKDIGLLDAFKNAPDVFLKTASYQTDVFLKVIRIVNHFQCSGTLWRIFPIQDEDKTTTNVTSDPGLFVIGHSTFFRKYHCNILIKCCGDQKCFRYRCRFDYSIRDWFRDPFDIGIELPGCTPFRINADWSETMEGNTCS